jgi:pimeloyl-ACP methyl ester carboxylesterase
MPKVETGAINTYYEVHGKGEPLVMIHGLGSSVRDWEYQVDFFADKFQVITYDVRGHGKTDKPIGPYNIPLFTDDLVRLLEVLDTPQAHIIGISMGGMVAFQLAVSYPERVRSLTIVNSWADFVPHSFRERLSIWQRVILFRLFSMRKIGEIIAGRLFIKPEQEEIRQVFIERWAENHKPAYMAATKGMVGWSVVDRVGEIACPTLLIAADEDYTPVAYKESYADQMRNAKLVVIEDSRHATPVEKPEEFNQAVMEFLEGVN